MKSFEIICCSIIFALAVAHPLPDNVLEQVEAEKDPSRPSLLLNDPSRSSLLLNDPTALAVAVKDPSLLSNDPTVPADLQKLPADETASASDLSQDDLQKQQIPEAMIFSEEALEAIFNDVPEESVFQNEK